MSERVNRFILGFSLIAFLFLEWSYGVYAIIGILIFEGITNLRMPILVSKLRYSVGQTTDGLTFDFDENDNCKFTYEAERLLRFTVATTISLGFIFFAELLWFLPWFVGLNLLLAGITGTCALLILLKKLGFK